MRGWSRERGARAGVARDPEGQSWPGGDNAAPGLGIACGRPRPGRGLSTWPAQVSRLLSGGTPPTFSERHRGGVLPAGRARDTDARRRPGASPLTRGRLREPGAGQGRGRETYLGKAGARHARRRNPARRGGKRGDGAGPRGDHLTPALPAGRAAGGRPRLRSGYLLLTRPPNRKQAPRIGKTTRSGGFSRTSSLEGFGELYPVFILRCLGQVEDCPNGCCARSEITSRLEGVTPRSTSVIWPFLFLWNLIGTLHTGQ